MKKTAKNLTINTVENAKPRETRYEVPDAGLPGFYLIVQPSGAKSFALRYRIHGVAKKLTIGSFPKYSLADARKLAREAAVEIHKGTDPNEQKKALRLKHGAPTTIDGLIEKFVAGHVRKNLRPRSQQEIERVFRNELTPWKGRPIDTIKKADVRELIDGLDGRPVLANRLLTHLKRLFSWAIEHDHLESSPCDHIRQPHKEVSRERILNDDELKSVLKAASKLNPVMESYLRLLTLTLARRNEITGMRWAEVDFKARTWTLPASRAKNKHELCLPLPSAAMAILESLGGADDTFVFPSAIRSGAGLQSMKRDLDTLITEENGEALLDWRYHDLRRTAVSNMARLGIALHVAEKCANHVSGSFKGIVGVYNRHPYLDEMREALECYASFLHRIEHGDNVLDFEARKDRSRSA